MRFPQWAVADPMLRTRYLCAVAALEFDPQANLKVLAREIGIPYQTLLSAVNVGRFSRKLTSAMVRAVPQVGIQPIWLLFPESMEFDEHGSVKE